MHEKRIDLDNNSIDQHRKLLSWKFGGQAQTVKLLLSFELVLHIQLLVLSTNPEFGRYSRPQYPLLLFPITPFDLYEYISGF